MKNNILTKKLPFYTHQKYPFLIKKHHFPIKIPILLSKMPDSGDCGAFWAGSGGRARKCARFS
jgi:hypothetical protein